MTLPLPKRAAELIGQVTTGFHPGLALDKHLDTPADAEQQKPMLQRVCLAQLRRFDPPFRDFRRASH
jgi:hypothetical protein